MRKKDALGIAATSLVIGVLFGTGISIGLRDISNYEKLIRDGRFEEAVSTSRHLLVNSLADNVVGFASWYEHIPRTVRADFDNELEYHARVTAKWFSGSKHYTAGDF